MIVYTIRRRSVCPAPWGYPGRSPYPGVTMRPTYAMDARLTVGQAATYFGLSMATVNRWYTLGHLKDVTHDGRGCRLYRFSELLTAERDTRRNPNSSRSKKRQGSLATA